MDLALNNLQRLICHKTQQTKPNQSNVRFGDMKNMKGIFDILNDNTKKKLCKLTNGWSMSLVNIQFSVFTGSVTR